jgi:hypothetical protein
MVPRYNFFALLILILKYVNCQDQNCKPVCCDVFIGNIGLECSEGGIDCAFSGQETGCCQSVNSLTQLHVGRGCVTENK